MMVDKDIQNLIKEIKELKIQGNTNIAKSSAKGLLEFVTHAKVNNLADFILKIKKYAIELAEARPNEPLAFNAMTFIIKDIEKCDTHQQVRVRLIERIESFFNYIDESYEIIRQNAFDLIKGYDIYMTHCHSSLVRDVLIKIHKFNPKIKVINTETRPMYQGRITAKKLSDEGVEVLQIVDSATSSILLDQRYSKPDVILVGSDGVTVDGDLINKIGTYNIAIAAKEAGIPVYVLTQSMKLDLRSSKKVDFEIELRDVKEIWEKPPKNVSLLNPAFDLVPAKYITGGYITEKGVLKPSEFKNFIH
jgi:ribose 1,5-bisphosphate isomerase